jgi:hypothetical protein
METLKPLDEIARADFRTSARHFTVEILRKIVAQYELLPTVPKNVRHQFEVARHAYIYAWYYTPLCAAAELYAILAAEHALRLKFRASPLVKKHKNEPGLKELVRIAIREKWIVDEGFDFDYRETVVTDNGFEYRPIPLENRRRPTDIVLEILPTRRNERAHGQPMMALEKVSSSIQLAKELINQLFPVRK